MHRAIRAVDHGSVAGGRYQSHGRVDQIVLGDQQRLHAALERVLGHRPHGVVDPVAPVDIPVVHRYGERLVVRAVDERPPGTAVRVAALDAVVKALVLVAPVDQVTFHVHCDAQRLEKVLVHNDLTIGAVQARPFDGRV